MITRKDFIILAGNTARMIKELNKSDNRAKDIILNEIVYFCHTQNGLGYFDENRFKSKVEDFLKW